MSRKKDRQRIEAMRALDPSYAGFRGHDKEPTRPGNVRLMVVTCSVCQRKRNVAEGIALKAGDAYICFSCQEEQSRTAQKGEASSPLSSSS